MAGRILIVEDNADNMKLISWVLEDEGYAFDCATSGEQAVEKLSQEDFALVLMDISLPGMDGKQTTRLLREDPRHQDLPIVAVTAHVVVSETESILASGVDGIVTKPLDEEELLGTVRALLR